MYSFFLYCTKASCYRILSVKKIKDISIKMFIDKEEEEKKAKDLQKNIVAIT